MSLTYGFALQPTDNSADFANAFYNIVGDGVARYGGQFALTANGFSVTVASGYGFVGGRWIENDEPLVLPIKPAGNNEDRTDGIAARVDYKARKANLEVVTGLDVAAIRANPALIRNDAEYCVVLFLVRVRRGATSLSPSDITDLRADSGLCGAVKPLSAIAGDVYRVYQFLASGIDEEVDRISASVDAAVQKAETEIGRIKEFAATSGAMPDIGDLRLCCTVPAPRDEWIPCDGGRVPDEYPDLFNLLGGVLPDISSTNYKAYIYGGVPVEV